MHHLKFYLIAGEVSPGGVLAPVLAPFGLDLPRLSRELNERTLASFVRGSPVSVKVTLLPSRSYSFAVGPPPLKFYLSQLRRAGSNLDALSLYNLVLLMSVQSRRSPFQSASMVFGSLHSFGSSLESNPS